MVADKGKKLKSEEGDCVEAELVVSIEKLQEVQDELDKINEEASDEVLEVEQKYNLVRRPVYVKRNSIIKTIPNFWLTAFVSHPALGDLLNDEDHKIFKYLDSIDVEDFKDVKSGYSISFNFNKNPYFEDTKLMKSFTFFDEGTTKIVGTTIKWKEGMGIANGDVHEKKGNKRSIVDESFFSWFGETQAKDDEVFHDEVAEIIKEDLWSNPLQYFNNDPEGDESDGDDEEDDDEDDDGHGAAEGNDDDDDDDDDDGEEWEDEDG